MLNRNAVIYQVFVRNHTKEGTFNALIRDLDRIANLNVDVLYLLPIHEIGVVNRKGTFGSPYSVKDYYSISEDLGNFEDFKALINATHERGLKIILDMVFHHTSCDANLIKEHPEFYYKNKEGKFASHIADWSDVYDLDTEKEEVQKYLIDVLKFYTDLGIDGFRFDVASCIPTSFFKLARETLGKEIIFIGESVDLKFADYLKSIKHTYVEDKDLVPYFDALYNYNWYMDFEDYLKGNASINNFINKINDDNLVRLNCVENHDKGRIASLTKSKIQLLNVIAFSLYLKGIVFIYAGEEFGLFHMPNLFEKDPLDFSIVDKDVYELYKKALLEKHIPEYNSNYKQHLTPIGKFGFKIDFVLPNNDAHQIIFNFSENKTLVAPVDNNLVYITGPVFSK